MATHKSSDGEEGLYRVFLDLLQQLKSKRYSSFWLDLQEWKDEALTWPQVHDVLAKMFRRQQIKIFFSIPKIHEDESPRQNHYSERYKNQEESGEGEERRNKNEEENNGEETKKKSDDRGPNACLLYTSPSPRD